MKVKETKKIRKKSIKKKKKMLQKLISEEKGKEHKTRQSKK